MTFSLWAWFKLLVVLPGTQNDLPLTAKIHVWFSNCKFPFFSSEIYLEEFDVNYFGTVVQVSPWMKIQVTWSLFWALHNVFSLEMIGYWFKLLVVLQHKITLYLKQVGETFLSVISTPLIITQIMQVNKPFGVS